MLLVLELLEKAGYDNTILVLWFRFWVFGFGSWLWLLVLAFGL